MPHAVPLLKQALQEPGAPAALRASIHQRLSLDVRFREGLDAAEEHALAAVDLAEQARRRVPARVGARRARPDPPQRGQARGARARRAGLRARPRRRAVAGRRGRGVLVRACARLVCRVRPRPRPPREPALRTGASGTSEWRPTRSGTWGWSSCGRGTTRWRNEYAQQCRQLGSLYVRDEVASPTRLFPLTLIAAHRGDLARARELAEETCRLSELHVGAPARAADDARDRRALERVAGRSRRLLQVGGGDHGCGRRRRTDDAAVAGRAGRGAARARPRRRGGHPSGRVGGRRAAARSRLGAGAHHPLPRPRRGSARRRRGGGEPARGSRRAA